MGGTHSRQLFTMTALLAFVSAGSALWFQYLEGAFDPLDRVALPAIMIMWVVLWLGVQWHRVRLSQAQIIVFSAYVAYFLLALDHQFKVFAPQYHTLSESTYWFAPLYAAAFMYFLPQQALKLSVTLFLLSLGTVLVNFVLNPSLLRDAQLMASCTQFLLVGAGMTALQFVMGQRHASMVALQLAAYQDALTGAANRRAAEEHLLALEKAGRTFSLALLDLDHFKSINDQHGHAVGDQVLREVVGVMQRQVPPETLVARWGGEEFLLILPDLPHPQLETLFSALGQRLSEQQIGAVSGVTASVGVARRRAGESLPALLERADRALYLAKTAGRNTVRFADVPPTSPAPEGFQAKLTT